VSTDIDNGGEVHGEARVVILGDVLRNVVSAAAGLLGVVRPRDVTADSEPPGGR